MTQNLKIEVLTGDISIDGMVVTNLVTKEELSTAIVKKADLGTDGKIPTSQLPAEIVNTAGIVDEVKLQLETSIKDAVDESNAYAESYTDNALSSKADLTSGKVPLEQLPAIDQYPQFGTALSNLSTSILSATKQRTDQLEKSKADLGEDGKVLREQIPSYEKISGLPEQLEVMSTQTAAVSGELDEHKLQTADQIDALKENIEANVQQLTDRQSHLMRTYATKELGVDTNVGVKPGEYFYVRSANEEEMLIEYQNVGGVATQSGKTYPSSEYVRDVKEAIINPTTGKADAERVFDGNENQRQINSSLIRTYNSVSDLLSIPNPRHGQVAFVRHYDLEQGILDGGGIFVYQNTNQLINDGGYIFNGWTRKLERPAFTPEMFGAKGDLSKDDAPNIRACINSARANKIKCVQFHNKYLIDSARIAGQETLLEMIPNCSFLGFGDAELVVGESIPDKFHILSAVNYIITTPDVGNVLVDGLKFRGLTPTTTNMSEYTSNLAMHTFGLNNVVIQRCTFDDLDLSNVIASGIRYDGSDYGSKVTIQDNKILSVVSENSKNIDHSSIYIEAPDSFVINNLFSSKTMQCKKVACAVEVHAPSVLTKGNQIYGYSRAGWLASFPINVHNSNFIDNIAHVSNHFVIVTTTDTAWVSKCRISGNTVRCEHATSEANFVTYQGLLVTSGLFDLGASEIVVDNNLLNIDYSVNPVFATIANLDQELSALFHNNTIYGAVAGLNALTLDSGGFTKNKVYNHITSAALNKDFFINIGGASLNSADLSSNEFKFNAATKPAYLVGLINMTGDALVSTTISGNRYLSTQKPQADVYFQPTLNVGGNANTLDINVYNASVNIPSLTAGQEHAWTQALTNNFNNCIVDAELRPEGGFYPLVTKGIASGSNLDMRVKAISTAAAFSVGGVNMRVRTR